MLTLRSAIFTFILLTIFYINGASNVQAQALRLTSFSETGNINGETIYSIIDIGFELRAVPASNNQGGTYSWTISGSYVLTEGTLTSRNIRVKWTTAGNNSVSVTYTGPQGMSSAALTVVVRTAEQSTDISPLPCSREGTINSSGSTYPTQILFSNTTNKTVKIYWLNYSGQRIEFWTLNAGQGVVAYTWLAHPWMITDENNNCLGIYQSIRDTGRVKIVNVKKVEFEIIPTDSEPLSLNPNTGGGRRFYPDKVNPGEATIRNQLRVKATLSEFLQNQKIYFRSFDVDDPSASTAPIDDDSGANANAEDNRGAVNGSKAGQLDPPASPACTKDTATNLWGCPVDSNGVAIINFTTTMQPGDNFAVAASTDPNYLAGITRSGTDLKDSTMATLPVPPDPNPTMPYALLRGARSEMLTVWRKLHIEVDSMGNVGTVNKVTGTITAVNQYADSTCNVPPVPSPPPQTPPCYPTVTGFTVSVALDPGRFNNGRIVIDNKKFAIFGNTDSVVYLKGVPPLSGKITSNKSFTLYDDDDYNNDDGGSKDGDENEPIVQLPESFKYLSAADGNYSDGKPRNVYASAYIMPEYQWAAASQYNQTNLPFSLNIADGAVRDTLLTTYRDSKNKESDDFWVAYFIVSYQGLESKDADGIIFNTQTQMYQAEGGEAGAARTLAPPLGVCDCYQNSNCPGVACSSTFPKGGVGSFIFEETMQDVHRTYLSIGTLLKDDIETTAPHELGHQLGLDGDVVRTTFKIMDYSDYPNNIVNDVGFHPEHINLLRRRVKSPGE